MDANNQEEKPINYDGIKVPGLGLVEEVQPLSQKISQLSKEIDSINIIRPIKAFILLRKVNAKLNIILPDFNKKLGESLGALKSPVDGAPGFLNGYLQAWSVGQSLSATYLLQHQWQRLTSNLDRKSAFTVAVLSIYIAVLALVLTTIFGILTLK